MTDDQDHLSKWLDGPPAPVGDVTGPEARLAAASVSETPPEAEEGTVPAVHPTQVRFPWRSALRTGFAGFLGALLAVAAASVFVAGFADQYIKGSGAVVLGIGVFCGGLATLLNRLALLPAVNAFITRLGFGATPKL